MSSWAVQFQMLRRRLIGPAAIYGLFLLLILLMSGHPENRLMIFRIYLFALPMLTAVLSPGLLVDDSALELVLTAPRRPFTWVFQRLAMIWLIAAGSMLPMWAIMAWVGSPIPHPPGWVTLLPSIALSSLALLAGLIGTQAMIGLAAAGLLWFVQVVLMGLLSAAPGWSNLFLFLGLFRGDLLTQQLTMGAVTALCLAGSSWAMRREERYL